MEVIKNRLPRVEAVIMAEGIQLKDFGPYYQGLCPFHEDKSPSFTVYKDTQKYHCFGCNVWGDVVGFIMKLHDKTFKQALSYLNIHDHKSSWRRPKSSMVDMIVAEEKQGIDVKAKYGDEFIQTLLAKEIIKLSKPGSSNPGFHNPVNNLHNIVKVNKNDQVLADKLMALANSAIDTIIYDE